MTREVPALPGLLSAEEVAATAAVDRGHAGARRRDPVDDGGRTPTCGTTSRRRWRCSSGGEVEAAHRAYDWCLATQRPDGSWPMRFRAGRVEDDAAETNMSAYLAVGVWHHWLVRREEAFVRRTWPAVRAAPRPRRGAPAALRRDRLGGPRSAPPAPADGALLAGSSSIHHALRRGLALWPT